VKNIGDITVIYTKALIKVGMTYLIKENPVQVPKEPCSRFQENPLS
jgi:hypothetical protein